MAVVVVVMVVAMAPLMTAAKRIMQHTGVMPRKQAPQRRNTEMKLFYVHKIYHFSYLLLVDSMAGVVDCLLVWRANAVLFGSV